jgi:hypothetical protein
MNAVSGIVSYLNRGKDLRQFAQPRIHRIHVPITDDIDMAKKFDSKLVRDLMDSNADVLKNRIVEKTREIQNELSDVDPFKFAFLKHDACAEMAPGREKKECEKIANRNIKLLIGEIKAVSAEIRREMKTIREQLKTESKGRRAILHNIKENKDNEELHAEYELYKGSQIYAMKKYCGKKTTTVSDLKRTFGEHPIAARIDTKIAGFNTRITELEDRAADLTTAHKKRIKEWKDMARTNINLLEKNVLKMTIRDEEKRFRETIARTKRENTVSIKEWKKEIKTLQTKRKKTFQTVKRATRKMIRDTKRAKRAADKETNDLRKTLRRQGEYQENIQNRLIQDLVDKYRRRIRDELI